MSTRTLRLNELVQREISAYLRKRYQSEAACMTISSVQIATDLKTAKVFVSVIGSEEICAARMSWLRKIAQEIRKHVGATIVMKWTPLFEYVLDDTPYRAARVLGILDEIEAREKSTPPAAPEAPKPQA
jgi:ribosome-binding factor A